MTPWQRLVGTRADPRRVPNPGVAFLGIVLAIGWLYLGVRAMTDGRGLEGAIGLGLAVLMAAWVLGTRRKSRDTSG